MKEDNNQDDGGRGHSRRDRLRRKIEEFHELHQMQNLQRAQFGQRGFLRPQVMELFEQEPMSGVDIMNKLQEMSRGWYRPSPGSIYPLLEQLEKEGLIAKNKEGKFELTSAYAEISGVAKDVASSLSALESNLSYLEDLQRADPVRLAKASDRLEKLGARLEGLMAAQGRSSS